MVVAREAGWEVLGEGAKVVGCKQHICMMLTEGSVGCIVGYK